MNYGVANRFDDGDYETIEINRMLKAYPELYKLVMEHELEHDEGDFTSKDLIHDMKSRTKGLFKFMLRHPSTWIQILPIYWHRKRKTIVWDWNAIVSWMILGAISWLTYIVIGWVSWGLS